MSVRLAVFTFVCAAVVGGIAFAGRPGPNRRREPRYEADDWGRLFI